MKNIFFKDIAGQVFGKLKVIKRVENDKHGSAVWECVCDCGNTAFINGSKIRRGATKSCGCLQKEKATELGRKRFKNISGIVVNGLTVLDFCGFSNLGGALWNVRCHCGKIFECPSGSLVSKERKSCGCNSISNILGEVFGKLKVISFNDIGEHHNATWICLCECGKEVIVRGDSLKSGATSSCGCMTESRMAFEIKNFYYSNFNAILEYDIFKNPKTNHPLYYDVFIPEKNVFIEIHGGQHYKFVKWFHGNVENFKYSKYKDKIKKKYAEENGIYIEIDLRKIKNLGDAINKINKIAKLI